MKSLIKSLGYFLMFLLGQIIITFLITVVLIIASGNNPDIVALIEKNALTITAISGIGVVLILMLIKSNDEMVRGEIKLKKINLRDCGMIILVFSGLIVVICTVVGMIITENSSYNQISKALSNGTGTVIGILSVTVVVPIIEEFVFRGFIFNELKKGMNIKLALIVQALIFGLAHMNLVQGSYAFVLGLFLGGFYLKTKSIVAPILGHIVSNFMGTIGLTYLSNILPEKMQNGLVVVSVALILLGVVYLFRKNHELTLEG